MADINGYQQKIDELIAANQAAEEEIARLEREAAAAYEMLGRKAYKLIGSLSTEQRNRLATESSRVDDLNAAVAHHKKDVIERSARIRQLQEMMRTEPEPDHDSNDLVDETRTCPVCGEKIQPNYSFCPGCASKVSELFPSEAGAVHKECPQCHKRWEPDMNFCSECGVKLVEVVE